MLLPMLLAAGFVHPTPAPPPELPARVYQERRARVLQEPGGCAAVLAAAGARGRDDYRQDGDFLWLTGVEEEGATGLAYGSIVGSAENGAVLHWGRNDRMLHDGELVVIDAAAEYGRYAADVTRTYPVGGKFSPEQAKVYRAVATSSGWRCTTPATGKHRCRWAR